MSESTGYEVAVREYAKLGEGPTWDVDRQRLIWVDILHSRVHSYDPATDAWTEHEPLPPDMRFASARGPPCRIGRRWQYCPRGSTTSSARVPNWSWTSSASIWVTAKRYGKQANEPNLLLRRLARIAGLVGKSADFALWITPSR